MQSSYHWLFSGFGSLHARSCPTTPSSRRLHNGPTMTQLARLRGACESCSVVCLYACSRCSRRPGLDKRKYARCKRSSSSPILGSVQVMQRMKARRISPNAISFNTVGCSNAASLWVVVAFHATSKLKAQRASFLPPSNRCPDHGCRGARGTARGSLEPAAGRCFVPNL